MTRLSQQASSPQKSLLVVCIILLSLVLLGLAEYLLKTNNNQHISLVTPTASPTLMSHSSPSSSPTPYSSTEIQQFLSPDGTKKLMLKVNYTSNLDTYSVYVSDTTKQHLIYSMQWGKGEALLSPSKDNWSLNNTYVFLILSGPDEIDPLIFKTDGSTFPNGNTYLDVDGLLQKQTSYYVNSPIRWVSNTQLELSIVKELRIQSFNYIFNVLNQTFTKLVK
jgi:hypothetical protein